MFPEGIFKKYKNKDFKLYAINEGQTVKNP